jgi:hypothetical protein
MYFIVQHSQRHISVAPKLLLGGAQDFSERFTYVSPLPSSVVDFNFT